MEVSQEAKEAIKTPEVSKPKSICEAWTLAPIKDLELMKQAAEKTGVNLEVKAREGEKYRMERAKQTKYERNVIAGMDVLFPVVGVFSAGTYNDEFDAQIGRYELEVPEGFNYVKITGTNMERGKKYGPFEKYQEELSNLKHENFPTRVEEDDGWGVE